MGKRDTNKGDSTTSKGAATEGTEQAQAGTNQPEGAGQEHEQGQNEGQEQEQAEDNGKGKGHKPEPEPEPEPELEREPAKATLVPMDNGQTEASPAAKELLLDACERFGIDPTEQSQPRELLNWKYLHEDRRQRIPAAVVLVTGGGVKLHIFADPDYMAPGCTQPGMNQDTEETLARIFQAFKKDPKTKEVTRIPLPEDMALPEPAVTGHATTTAHRYRRGYLREGGKEEANRRDAAAKGKKK